jgi:hypothetical protein
MWGCNNSEIVAKKYSADQEPRWGCNNSEIVATSIVLMIWQPSEELLIECAANLH